MFIASIDDIYTFRTDLSLQTVYRCDVQLSLGRRTVTDKLLNNKNLLFE